jgi:hypothetical protein
LFARRSSDGLLYYYQQEENTFKYGTNPYTRWKGGVNVTTQDGTSFLNIENSIDPISCNNCLVKMDFSKKLRYINLYLFDKDKWNFIAKFKLENMDITKAHTIDFDKSIMESNNNLFTFKRGHHFIEVKHAQDDLLLPTRFDNYKQVKNGIFEEVHIDKPNDLLSFNNFFYIKLENNNSDYGLMVVKTDFTNIYANKLPKSKNTILIPYNKKATEYNSPENLINEWFNHVEQKTDIGA